MITYLITLIELLEVFPLGMFGVVLMGLAVLAALYYDYLILA